MIMSTYFKTSKAKALSLLLAITVAVVWMFAVNSEISYAVSKTKLDSVEVTVDIPKCGVEITKVSTYEQDPAPDIQIVTTDPQYNPYGGFWPIDSGNPGWYKNLYEGTVDGDTPLYLEMSFYIEDTDNYYWANTPNKDDPDTDHDESEEGKYTGTVTVNGKQAEVVYTGTWERGKYLDLIVKLSPEHDWDDGTVTTEPTATKEGVKTYKCKGCETTKTEAVPKKSDGSKPKTKTTAKKPLMAKLSAGSNSITFAWNKVKGADGYDIYLCRCDYDGKKFTPKKIKTIKGAKTKWTKKGLKKHTAYKGYVKAFKMVKGKKKYISTSQFCHEYTTGGNKWCTNAKSVTVNKKKVTLKKGKTFKIKAKVVKKNSKKKLMPSYHAPAVRYKSSNSKVAKVSSSGKVTAKGKGTCSIYAYAHNGVQKVIKVTVK